MSDSEWEIPDDAEIGIKTVVKPASETPILLAIEHKDSPLGAKVGLSVDQAAMLQHTLDELLDELEERPTVRTRTEASETDSRGVY